MNKIVCAFASVFPALIMGCASNDAQKSNQHQKSQLNNAIYTKLIKTSSGWEFSDFSDTHIINGVNLETGLPQWETSERRCISGLGVKGRVDYCDKVVNEDLFVTSSIDTGNAVLSAIMIPFSFGISATTVYQDVTFDQEAFNAAYKEAYSKIDKKQLEDIDQSITSWKGKRLELSQLYKRALDNWESSFKVSFQDVSGISQGIVDDHDPNKWIYLSENMDTPKVPVVGKRLSEFASELNKLKQYKLNQDIDRYSQAKVICTGYQNLTRDYNFNVKCPSKAKVDIKNQRVDGSAYFEITGKNKERVYPTFYSMNNEDIVISMSSGKVYLENKTSEYVTIEEISFYYKDQIASRTNLAITLPPESRTDTSHSMKDRKSVV